MVQKSCYGPIICMIAPKVTMAKKKAIEHVRVMTNANVLKNTKFAK